MTQISKEYGEALFVLAKESGLIEQISRDLELIKELISREKAYLEFLSSPAIPLSERLGAIDEAFEKEVCEYAVSFLKLLCENGYAFAFFECVDEFLALEKRWRNHLNVKVISAIALSEEQKRSLCERLEKTYHKRIEASYSLDPTLMGGIRVETEDTVIDASMKQKLQKLKGVISE